MTASVAVVCPGVIPSNWAGAYVDFPAPLDPDDQGVNGVDYAFDWGPWLDGAGTGKTVATATVTPVDGGLVISLASPTGDGRGVGFWARVSSAVPGSRQRVRCEIVDSDGRPQTRTGVITVAHR